MNRVFENLIGGGWRGSGDAINNMNPSNPSDVVGRYAVASAADVDDAVVTARAAQHAWWALTPQDRADRLEAVAAELAARREELARQLSREEGKTLREARPEITKAAHVFRFYAGEAIRMSGEHVASIRPGIDVDVIRRPLGVVALITPWNFPLSIPAWKSAPALAYGNAVILKPSELTNASAWSLAEIVNRHLSSGVFQLAMGDGRTGAALASHAGIDGVSFTGSVATGRRIAETAPPHVRVQLEMGGKNALIVMEDADIPKAVDAAVKGAFFSTGQRCTASSRLIVHRAVKDRFLTQLVTAMSALKVGDALDESTDIGPMISQAQLDRVQDYLRIGREEGAHLRHGGERVEGKGWFMRPALFVDTGSRQRINQEEIFGPVATIIEVDDIEAAIAIANDTGFGLCAGIFTNSLGYARAFRRGIVAGMAMVNLPTVGTDYHVPFGGVRSSSYGPREKGFAAREFFTTTMTFYTAA